VTKLSKLPVVGLIFVWELLPSHSVKNSMAPVILRGRHFDFVFSISAENNFFAVQTAFDSRSATCNVIERPIMKGYFKQKYVAMYVEATTYIGVRCFTQL